MSDKKILVQVVDDEADFRKVMTFWLESKGYAVISADNGENAIKQLKDNNPDIIFMDIRMPVMGGMEAIREIREFNQDVPIIIISAYVDDPSIGDISKLGISGIFYKGKDFAEGLALLESTLRTHKKLKK
ncbi:MAG: response regulator [Candidatus Omnitrophica bacterium]|nr:response regulator [Candidatus Omnitrophota bacterium]MDD5552976.1 response regulator [Candidatus Omnitrophota bacterium]